MGLMDWLDPQRIALVFAGCCCLKYALLLMLINASEVGQPYYSSIESSY
jgi:hypothetical protein